MEKLLEVREYDVITGNAAFEHDKDYKYLAESVFGELLTFIHQFSGDEENADALDFLRITYKRNVGQVVTVKNYVGLIQLNSGYQIQVLPKICLAEKEDESNTATKKVFLQMLKCMKDFPLKIFHTANLNIAKMNLYEIFINMYLQETRQLVRRGIKSDYVRQEANLRFFKGKLLTGKHLKENLAHGERFYVSYDEFLTNRAENRLVKATLLKLQRLTSSAENAKEIRQLLIAFEHVESSKNYEKDFSQVVINRNTKDYERLICWAKIFLMNKSFTTFNGKENSRALLFPMERVYESYVAKHVKRILGPFGWEVSCQDKGHYLFTEPRQQFALRPDIVCKCGERVVIMDTKWKSLINNERKNYGISQSDMYQMYAYSKKYATSEIWLLYPVNDEMRGHEEIKYDSGDGTTVRLHFVDVENIDSSLNELREKLKA